MRKFTFPITRSQDTKAGYELMERLVSNGGLDIIFMCFEDYRLAHLLLLRTGLEDGKPKSIREVAQIYGLTSERIVQIQYQALKRLEKAVKSIEKMRGFTWESLAYISWSQASREGQPVKPWKMEVTEEWLKANREFHKRTKNRFKGKNFFKRRRWK